MKRICIHCGRDTRYQPPKESNCNHVHYPEACIICSKNAAYTQTITSYNLDAISIIVPDDEDIIK